jgi:alkylation response protein AidB-like acyl-CoA dehydrogenase
MTWKALGLRAAWAFNNKENEAEILAACAKVFSGEAVTKIANWATQVFSGHGYIKGSEIERLYRDARFCEFCEGTSKFSVRSLRRTNWTSSEGYKR